MASTVLVGCLAGAGAACQSDRLLVRADQALANGHAMAALSSYETYRKERGDRPALVARRKTAVRLGVDGLLARAERAFEEDDREEARNLVWRAVRHAERFEVPESLEVIRDRWAGWRDVRWPGDVEALAQAGRFQPARRAAHWWTLPGRPAASTGAVGRLVQRAQEHHRKLASTSTGAGRIFHWALARAFGAQGLDDRIRFARAEIETALIAANVPWDVNRPSDCGLPWTGSSVAATSSSAHTAVVTLTQCPDISGASVTLVGQLQVRGPGRPSLLRRPFRRSVTPSWSAVREALFEEVQIAAKDLSARRALFWLRAAEKHIRGQAHAAAEDALVRATWGRGAPPDAAVRYFEQHYGLSEAEWIQALEGHAWTPPLATVPRAPRLPPPLRTRWEAGWARQAVRRQGGMQGPEARDVEGTLGAVVASTPVSGRTHGFRWGAAAPTWAAAVHWASPALGASGRRVQVGGQIRVLQGLGASWWIGLEWDHTVVQEAYMNLSGWLAIHWRIGDGLSIDAELRPNLLRLTTALTSWETSARLYSPVQVGLTIDLWKQAYLRFDALHDLGRDGGPWIRVQGGLGARL